jgi:hypothetical protein
MAAASYSLASVQSLLQAQLRPTQQQQQQQPSLFCHLGIIVCCTVAWLPAALHPFLEHLYWSAPCPATLPLGVCLLLLQMPWPLLAVTTWC